MPSWDSAGERCPWPAGPSGPGALKDAEQLCWDEFCLTIWQISCLSTAKEITAVTAKGCDWRNLVVHHQEGRLDLVQPGIVVLGIDCEGMLDPEKISRAAGGPERVLEVRCVDEQVTITVPDGEVVIDRADVYRQSCLECIQRAPLSADDLLQNPEARRHARQLLTLS